MGSPSQVINEECPNKIVNLLDELRNQMVDVMPTEDDVDVPMMLNQARKPGNHTRA